MPPSAYASEPRESFTFGMPKRSTAGMPSENVSLASATILSTDCWKFPGIEAISFFTFFPCVTKSG